MKMQSVRMRRVAFVLATVGAASWASAGQAQQVGTYSGTTADGNGLSFDVGIDPNTGLYEFTGAGIGFTAYCRKSNYYYSTGWGFGLGQDIVSGNNNVVVNPNSYNYFYINYNLSFPDNNTITGTVNSATAVFESGDPPTKADFCKAPKNQSFTATFQSAGQFKPPHGAAAVNYGKAGTTSH